MTIGTLFTLFVLPRLCGDCHRSRAGAESSEPRKSRTRSRSNGAQADIDAAAIRMPLEPRFKQNRGSNLCLDAFTRTVSTSFENALNNALQETPEGRQT